MLHKIRAGLLKGFFYILEPLGRKRTSPSKDVGPVAGSPSAPSFGAGAYSWLNGGSSHTDSPCPRSFNCSIGKTYPRNRGGA